MPCALHAKHHRMPCALHAMRLACHASPARAAPMQALRGTKEVHALVDALSIDASNPAIVLTQVRQPAPSGQHALCTGGANAVRLGVAYRKDIVTRSGWAGSCSASLWANCGLAKPSVLLVCCCGWLGRSNLGRSNLWLAVGRPAWRFLGTCLHPELNSHWTRCPTCNRPPPAASCHRCRTWLAALLASGRRGTSTMASWQPPCLTGQRRCLLHPDVLI